MKSLCRDCGALGASVEFERVLRRLRLTAISAETTLAQDEADADKLARALWPLCERISAWLKHASLAAGTIALRLKTANFRLRPRSRRIVIRRSWRTRSPAPPPPCSSPKSMASRGLDESVSALITCPTTATPTRRICSIVSVTGPGG